MSAIAITAANVLKGSNASIQKDYLAGETVTAGQGVYLKAADSKWYLGQCDGTLAESQVQGVALHGASAGQPLQVQVGGLITIGGTIAVGVFYYVSPTAGGICAVADLASTNYVTVLGYGTTTGIMNLSPVATGLALA